MPKKLYDVLDVREDASAADIRRAYRRKVKESHPDVSDEPDAAETFQLIVTAKDVLTDAEERERYDDLGHDAYMDWFGEDGSNGGSGSGSASSSGASGTADSETDARDHGSVDDSSGTTDTSGSSSGSASGGAAGVDFGERTSGSSGSGSSGNATSGATGSSSATSSSGSGPSSSSEPSSSSSSGSGSNSSGPSTAPSSSTGEDSSSGNTASSGSTRESTGAVSESAVAEEAERTRKRWQAASRSGGPDDATSPWSTSSSQGEHLAAERVDPGIATRIRSRDAIEMTLVMLVAYPIFLFAATWDGFPRAVRVTVGVLTVVVLLYTLTEPVVGVVVFGTWSTLAPVLMLFARMELLSPFGLFALTVTWVPFLLALLLTLATPE